MKSNSAKQQPSDNKLNLRVAIVCDWLTGYGGAEKVVLELHKMFPGAPIYTSQYDPSKISWFDDAVVRTGWLQKLPSSLKKFLPILRAYYFSHLDLSEYDLIISETGAEAKAVKFGAQTNHICICNAPTHYYWSRYEQYLAEPGFPKGSNWLARLGLGLFINPLRKWDYRASQKPTHMIAISSNIKFQIKKYYNRSSVVIAPPVDAKRFSRKAKLEKEDYLVITGRQVPYKRFDLAIKACTELGINLKVVGDGPEHNNLMKIAGETIEFTGRVGDDELVDIIAHAKAFIFPGLDDFGIAPVEALATGTPVIAFKAGGALDYIEDGLNGLFFAEQTTDSLIEALKKFEKLNFDSGKVAASAENFSEKVFRQSLEKFIKESL